MSRIGKKPVQIPEGVTVTIQDQTVTVKGPKGTNVETLHPVLSVTQKDDTLVVACKNPEEKMQRALWGLGRALVANMVLGATKGFEKRLEINGVGFRASVSGKKLILSLGFSHPIEYQIPEGIALKVEKNIIIVNGSDKQLVGQVAAHIRAFRVPEPYKGKGIRYIDEIVRRKAGKAVKTAGAGS